MKNEKPKRPIGRRPSREGRKTFWLTVATAAVLVLLGVAHTWTRVAVLERKYQLSSAQAESARLTSELKKLELEVATYQSEKRIDEAAHQLAMTKPAPTAVVVVPPMLASDSPVSASKSALAANEADVP